MGIPDILRASYFVRDIKRAKTLPSFNFVYLPQDHTSGGGAGSPSPNAHLADNDLALGRVVEAVSNSRFWRDTVIFVVEDDPQAGFDHVDGHRSICLAISAYSKRKAVVSKFYNQGSVLKSIRHIFGIPAATRTEMEASLMSDCFQAKPNLAPYRARPNNVRLDETNPSRSTMKRLDLRRPDLADENVFNRQLWTLAKPGTRYPAHLAGAHGKGLAARGLRSVGVADD
jgi:phospholipase C